MRIEKENIINQLYSNVVVIYNDGETYTAKDASGNVVSIDLDAVEAEFLKQNYINQRTTTGTTTYAPTSEQMAMIYDDIIAGKLDTTGSFAAHNKSVKDANPKP
jgi:hypothetical protein|tara:strand:+ start:592 stop:903 length:312 start_codon:yes stop_codon:yes gene_type:complete